MTVQLLKGSSLPGICVNDMKDGQIAEIVKWEVTGDTTFQGQIVQRVEDSLISIGRGIGKSFDSIFCSGRCYEHCRVRLLEPGETLRIVKN